MAVKECPPAIKAFGRDLFVWLRQEEPDFAGWYSQQCDVVAVALKLWIGPGAEIWVHAPKLVPSAEFDHVLVRVGNCFLDDQGAWTEDEVLRTWRGISYKYVKAGVRPAVPGDGVIEGCSRADVKRLADGLRRTFGPGTRVLEWAKER